MNTLDNQLIGILPKNFMYGADTFRTLSAAITGKRPKHLNVYHEPTSPWQLEEGGTALECTHEFYHNEEIEVDTMRDGEHDTYMSLIVVCDDCERDLEIEPEYE